MGDFIKELNIIDFLGIMLPGSSFLLLINYTELQTLTGLQFTAADTVFLLVGGYIVGSLFHEIWDILEKWLWKCSDLDPKTYAAAAVEAEVYGQNQDLKDWTSENLNMDFSNRKQKKSAKPQIAVLCCILSWTFLVFFGNDQNGTNQSCYFLKVLSDWLRKIFSYFWGRMIVLAVIPMVFYMLCRVAVSCRRRIQTKTEKTSNSSKSKSMDDFLWVQTANPVIQTKMVGKGNFSKRTVFDGFHVMMRNLFLTMETISLYAWMKGIPNPTVSFFSEYVGAFPAKILLVAVQLTMLVRSVHYAYLKYKYTYENFVEVCLKATDRSG